MTEYEKMLSGDWYDPLDTTLRELRLNARQLTWQFNKTAPEQHKVRRRLLQQLCGAVGKDVFIEPPFHCDYGKHISFGDQVFLNFNCTILDVAPVTLGNYVFVGPGVQFYTVNHPLDALQRRTGIEQARPITIGNDVWLGGGVIICPGVTIGEQTVVAAGSVVTRNLPARVLAGGNPCKVIRELRLSEMSVNK